MSVAGLVAGGWLKCRLSVRGGEMGCGRTRLSGYPFGRHAVTRWWSVSRVVVVVTSVVVTVTSEAGVGRTLAATSS